MGDVPHVARQQPGAASLSREPTAVAHAAHDPEPVRSEPGRSALRWLLEGRGLEVSQAGVDLLAACIATVVALGGVHAAARVPARDAPLLALPPIAMLLLYVRGLYHPRLRTLALESLVPGVSAVSVAGMVVVVLGLLVNGQAPDEVTWLLAWGLAVLVIGIGRTAVSLSQRAARRRRLIGRPVLIVGAGKVGAQVARRLESRPEYGLRPVGLLDDDPRSLQEVGACDVPVVGSVEDVDAIVARSGIRDVIVAFSSVADARVSRLIGTCQELGVEVSVVPRLFDTMNNRTDYESIGGLPLLSLHSVSPTGWRFALKHALDRVCAGVLLLLLSPLMALIALAVRASSPGPVWFRQRRVGRDGAVFDLYKFRSMREPEPHADRADQDGGVASSNGSVPRVDPDIAPGGAEDAERRTRVGRTLRRSGLDELPQLVNVLRGEMSLVGPRPERPEFVERFEQRLERYDERLRVKSGITGWAQVHGLRGNTSLAERVEWDNYYIAHWSLGLDLKIILLTVVALLRGA